MLTRRTFITGLSAAASLLIAPVRMLAAKVIPPRMPVAPDVPDSPGEIHLVNDSVTNPVLSECKFVGRLINTGNRGLHICVSVKMEGDSTGKPWRGRMLLRRQSAALKIPGVTPEMFYGPAHSWNYVIDGGWREVAPDFAWFTVDKVRPTEDTFDTTGWEPEPGELTGTIEGVLHRGASWREPPTP